jgi:hypothetical protein
MYLNNENAYVGSGSIGYTNELSAPNWKALDFARHCALELVMKDVHTLYNQPARLGRWVQIAREEIMK